MAWYSTGTARPTVGSVDVIGVGTNWTDDNVKPGDTIHFADGRAFEIAARVSLTELQIAIPYDGDNAVAGSYGIAPTNVADRLVTLIGQQAAIQAQFEGFASHGPREDNPHGVTIAQVGGQPTINPEFSGGVKAIANSPNFTLEEEDTGAVAKMLVVNAITYIQASDANGAQAGAELRLTGGSNQSLGLLRASIDGGVYDILHANRILGTVGQSSGFPTGAIFEKGSNGNGSFTRFADGLQILSGSFTFDFSNETNQTANLPASSLDILGVAFCFEDSTINAINDGLAHMVFARRNNNSLRFQIRYENSAASNPGAGVTALLHYTVVSRWY